MTRKPPTNPPTPPPIHPILRYIEAHNMSQTAFARLIEVERATINRWVMGHGFPSRELARRVVERTNREISLEELYDPTLASSQRAELLATA